MKTAALRSIVIDPPAAKEHTHTGRFTNLDPDKVRGGYYTSPELARWLCAWAIRTPADAVLEPSCGDGIFLEAAAKRLRSVGASPSAIGKQIQGVEIIEAEAERAEFRLRGELSPRGRGVVACDDFFAWWQSPDRNAYDVAIGNPPFIRYQTFPEPHRSQGMAIMEQLGLRPNRLTNIWVPFVVAAAAGLRPGGRLAFVLPAELLQVSYASQLRSYLTDRFTRIDIVACNELFFAKAEQEVLLLLADGALAKVSPANTCSVAMTETRTVAEVVNRTPAAVLAGAETKIIRHDHEKWLKYFLTPAEIAFMRDLRAAGVASPLTAHASIDVGVVTGKNEFFVLTQEQISTLGLAGHTVPLVSRAAHLKGARIRKPEWRSLAAEGNRVHLLHPHALGKAKPPAALGRYIASGEAAKVHTGYKCSIRDPWYMVPSVWIPDGFAFRQIYDFPRIVHNQAQATSTDTIHRLTCKGQPERTIANTYTHLTAASAEIEGRSYGGGVLELEPTESERLLMPTDLVDAMPLNECDRLIRAGRLADVLHENDRLILQKGMGLSSADCVLLRGIWTKMRDRRSARRRKRPVPALPVAAE